MTETVHCVASDIALIPREAVGLKPSASGGVAGDVSALKPRKEKLPAIAAGVKLSGEAVVGEVVQKLNDSGEVVRHEKVPPYSFLTQL
jgi:hypothetical protein